MADAPEISCNAPVTVLEPPRKRGPGGYKPSRVEIDPEGVGKALATDIHALAVRKAAKLLKICQTQVQRDRKQHNADANIVNAKRLAASTMREVTLVALTDSLSKIPYNSCLESATTAGIYTQRANEVESSLPPADQPNIDQALDQCTAIEAKLDHELALLEELRDRLSRTPPPAVPQESDPTTRI